MGYPLNTVEDDIYFCLSEDGRTGYFSSSRAGGLGGQDIHEVVFPANQVEYLLVQGIVADANEQPVAATITLTKAPDGGLFGTYKSNERTGRYVMAVRPGQAYRMHVAAVGYEPWEQVLATDDDEMSGMTHLDVSLTLATNTAGTLPQH